MSVYGQVVGEPAEILILSQQLHRDRQQIGQRSRCVVADKPVHGPGIRANGWCARHRSTPNEQPAYAADLTEATTVMDSARNAVRDLPSSPTHGITSRPLTVTGCPSVNFGCSPATVTLMISPPSGPFTYSWTTHCSRPVVLSCRCAPVFRSTFGSGPFETSGAYPDVSSTSLMTISRSGTCFRL